MWSDSIGGSLPQWSAESKRKDCAYPEGSCAQASMIQSKYIKLWTITKSIERVYLIQVAPFPLDCCIYWIQDTYISYNLNYRMIMDQKWITSDSILYLQGYWIQFKNCKLEIKQQTTVWECFKDFSIKKKIIASSFSMTKSNSLAEISFIYYTYDDRKEE